MTPRLADRLPLLCLVTDRKLCGADALAATVDAAVSGGVDLVQLREKDVPDAELLPLAIKLRDAIGDRALLVINGSLDVAIAAEADGLHLPEESLPLRDAREAAPRLLLSKAVHDPAAAAQAEAHGADALVLGTVFETASKPGAPAGGLRLVREATRGVRAPVLAIGGIDVSNAASVIEAGASGVAVVSAIMAAPDPEAAASRLKQAMLAAWAGRARVGAGV